MADKPQFYQEYKWVSRVEATEGQIIRAKETLVICKAQLEAVKIAVDADAEATAEMITLANQANSFVNNAKYTDLIVFIEANLT